MVGRQANPGDNAGTRGAILKLLRRAPLTANELAAELGFSHNAIRVHLGSLLADGLIRELGMRPSGTRPAVVYELTAEADVMLSRAYIPFVTHLMRVLGSGMQSERLEGVMRDVGRELASEQPPLQGDLRQKLASVSVLLAELGAPNDIEEDGDSFLVRGHGCVLSTIVHEHSEACRSMESFLQSLLNVPVNACCDRTDRPRCCFQVSGLPAR